MNPNLLLAIPRVTIDVTPGRQRFAVAYRLTNDLDDLDAMAFVIVPPVPSGDDEPVVEDTQKPKTPEELAALLS